MSWTTWEYVYCGKNCTGCPHGPYRYDWQYKAGKKHKVYVGPGTPPKKTRRSHGPAASAGPQVAAVGTAAHPHDAILSRKTAGPALALEILGLSDLPDAAKLKATWRALSAKHHPDRGGDPRTFERISAAVSYLKPHCAP